MMKVYYSAVLLFILPKSCNCSGFQLHFSCNKLVIMKTMETVTDFKFLGSNITADGDCSHKIRRHLLLGRKAMPNLDSILKGRDISLPTKVHIVKAVVFSVVIGRCDSWTIKKGECQRIDVFELSLQKISWTARRSNQSIPKEINPEYLWEGLMLKLKLQYFVFSHLI